MSSRGGGAGAKRKHSALASGSRAQQKKLASKAAKRSSASAAAAPRRSAAEERELNDALFFESDDEDGGGRGKKARGGDDDLLIRDPRARRRSSAAEDGDYSDAADDDDDDGARGQHEPPPPEDPFAHETPDEKRVRLARAYLQRVEADVDDELAAAADGEDGGAAGEEIDEDEADEERRGITRDAAVDRKLKANLLAAQGKLKSFVAHARYDASAFPPERQSEYMRVLGGHKKGGATCITLAADNSTMYTGGKDCNIVHWDVETGKKLHTLYGNRAGKYYNVDANAQGHQADVLSLSLSTSGDFLASGSADATVKIWDPRASYRCVQTFAGAHKAAVTGVAFRVATHTLFTSSLDRTLRLYNIDQLAHVETLYGHTAGVTALDALTRERCVSVAQDKTARLWKVVEESQLLFRASTYCESLDCVSLLNEDQFVTGGQDGSVAAWLGSKKKPTGIIPQAHGEGNWISSVGAQRFTDVCFSGSRDGFLNLYCLESAGRLTNKLALLHRVPTPAGWINGIVSDARDGRFAALAIGREHRLGRWEALQGQGRGGVVLVSLAGVEQQKAQLQEQQDDMERGEDENDEEDADDAPRSRQSQQNGRTASAAAAAADSEEEEEEAEPRFGVPGQQRSFESQQQHASTHRKPTREQQAKMKAKKPLMSAPARRGGRGGARGGGRGGR